MKKRIDPAVSAYMRTIGLRGAARRMETTTPKQRHEIAKNAAAARKTNGKRASRED